MIEQYYISDHSGYKMDDFVEMVDWCREHFGSEKVGRRWGWDYPLLVFVHEQDLMWFQLKWSEHDT